ncbi:hypothetical protein EV426DRAFT_720607 [Tirmania nivea]|nr:hypothetical protein EV426DRAFT_720607 [Tirmania nivea]
MRKYLPRGWRLGVLASSIAAFIVFMINLCTTIWAIRKYPLKNGLGTIFEGSCETTKTLSLWIHLVINGLSTVLLSASNYTIQCLISPTRKDLDAAHSEGKWLDIGVPSLRNVGRLHWVLKVLWATLWISSLPLHLVYNSAVFPTTSTHGYNVTIAPENTLEYSVTELERHIKQYSDSYESAIGRWYTNRSDVDSYLDAERIMSMADALRGVVTAHSNLAWQQQLSMDCLTAYNTRFPSRFGNLILVMPRNDSAVIYDSFDISIDGGITSWLSCPHLHSIITGPSEHLRMRGCDPNNPTAKHLQAGNWTFDGKTVQWCLVEERNEKCTFQFSSSILYTVIVCNALKVVAMLALFLRSTPMSSSPPLVTIGDAVQSFLVEPDRYTIGICYAGRNHLTPKPRRKTLQTMNIHAWNRGQPQPRVWKTQRARTRWWRAISARRWAAAVIPGLIAIPLVADFINHSFQGLTFNTEEGINLMWKRGFGQLYIDSLAWAPWSDSVEITFLQGVLYANTPQLILSFMYLMYNSLFTGMVMGQEWNRFASITDRQYLRVTYPQGEQRETYWLQLPYRYALPLMACSAFIHWSTSQALFFTRLRIDNDTFSRVGYSVLATVVSLGFGGLLLLVVCLFGFRHYQNDMPTVGSCSAAISAACHPIGALTRRQREELVLKPLQWGDVGVGGEGFRHLSFSDKEVGVPIESETYAGVTAPETI